MSFTKLVDLLETLLANEEKLVDKTEGKSKGKANQKSYGMQTIRAAFPSEKESYGVHCQGVATCLIHLFSRYITTIEELTQIFPLMRAIQPYCYSSEAWFLSKVKSSMKEPKWGRDKKFLETVDEMFVQTQEEKSEQNEESSGDANLQFRVENPIQFELPQFLADIKKAYKTSMETNDQSMLGIALESAVPGSRSIDLINGDLMQFRADPSDKTVLLVSGHSKVRTEKLWKTLKAAPPKRIQTIAITPAEALAGIAKYRLMVAPTIAHVEQEHKSQIDQWPKKSLKRIQAINAAVSSKLNANLGKAMKVVFPTQAAQASAQTMPGGGKRKFSSHEARAASSNASYELYGAGKSIDLFLKQSLNHHNTGSVVHYKGISFNKPEQGVKPSSVLIEKVAGLIVQVEEMKVEIEKIKSRESETDSKHNDEGGSRKRPREEKVPTKRKIPKHRPVGPQTSKPMKSVDGKSHTFTKFKRIVGLSEEDFQRRVDEGEAMLKAKGVPITNGNLRALGLGARGVNCLRTGSKAADGCEASDYSKELSARSAIVTSI
jgi:hypothetical protein